MKSTKWWGIQWAASTKWCCKAFGDCFMHALSFCRQACSQFLSHPHKNLANPCKILGFQDCISSFAFCVESQWRFDVPMLLSSMVMAAVGSLFPMLPLRHQKVHHLMVHREVLSPVLQLMGQQQPAGWVQAERAACLQLLQPLIDVDVPSYVSSGQPVFETQAIQWIR